MTEKNKLNKHKLIRSIILTDRRQTTPGHYLEAWSRMWSWDYSEEIQATVRVADMVLVLMKIALMHHDEAWNPPETSLFQSCLGVQNCNQEWLLSITIRKLRLQVLQNSSLIMWISSFNLFHIFGCPDSKVSWSLNKVILSTLIAADFVSKGSWRQPPAGWDNYKGMKKKLSWEHRNF